MITNQTSHEIYSWHQPTAYSWLIMMSGWHEVNLRRWKPVERLDEVHFYCRQEEIKNLRSHSADKDSQKSVHILFGNKTDQACLVTLRKQLMKGKLIVKSRFKTEQTWRFGITEHYLLLWWNTSMFSQFSSLAAYIICTQQIFCQKTLNAVSMKMNTKNVI